MHYLSKDQFERMLATGASQLYAEAYVFLGKLYDQAYVAHRNEGYGQTTGEFNGKEINCTISNRCINGKLSRNTSWKINGKRISQKQLLEAVCKVL